jgi:hypothetical protein
MGYFEMMSYDFTSSESNSLTAYIGESYPKGFKALGEIQ